VLQAGRVVECGTHAELARREGGVYRTLLETEAAPGGLAPSAGGGGEADRRAGGVR